MGHPSLRRLNPRLWGHPCFSSIPGWRMEVNAYLDGTVQALSGEFGSVFFRPLAAATPACNGQDVRRCHSISAGCPASCVGCIAALQCHRPADRRDPRTGRDHHRRHARPALPDQQCSVRLRPPRHDAGSTGRPLAHLVAGRATTGRTSVAADRAGTGRASPPGRRPRRSRRLQNFPRKPRPDRPASRSCCRSRTRSDQSPDR